MTTIAATTAAIAAANNSGPNKEASNKNKIKDRPVLKVIALVIFAIICLIIYFVSRPSNVWFAFDPFLCLLWPLAVLALYIAYYIIYVAIPQILRSPSRSRVIEMKVDMSTSLNEHERMNPTLMDASDEAALYEELRKKKLI